MSDEAAFHDGYRKALEEVSGLVDDLNTQSQDDLGGLLEELRKRIERARCLSRSSLAAKASGDQGY